MSGAAWLMLLGLSFFWGSSFYWTVIALQGLSVLAIVAFRLALAAAVLWLVVWLTGARVPRELRIWGAYLVMGLLNSVIPFALIAWGQKEVSSSLASVLIATTPVFTVVIAALFLNDEPATRTKIAGVIIGFLGVVVMIGPDALNSHAQSVMAQLAIVLAGVSYATATVFGRRFHGLGFSPNVSAACQVSVSTIFILPFAYFTGGFDKAGAAPPIVWVAVASLAVLSTAVAYMLYFRILAIAGATNAMLVTFLIPVTAILLGTLILHETLNSYEVLGILLIAMALVTIDGRLLSRRPTGD
jgi:drug/metabolite transporter (DMT)-like permease